MAEPEAVPELKWDSFDYDTPWPCKDGCCEYFLFNNELAAVNHDRIFTHVENDNDFLDYKYASLRSELLDIPNLSYKDFVYRIWTDDIVDQMIIGTNEYGMEWESSYENGICIIYIAERA